MTWKETTQMEQKIEFINEFKSGNYSITELCKQFEISRPTAYKYIKRFEKEGVGGLKEKPRIHKNHPHNIAKEIEDKIIKHRKKHPRWGVVYLENLECQGKFILITAHHLALSRQ